MMSQKITYVVTDNATGEVLLSGPSLGYTLLELNDELRAGNLQTEQITWSVRIEGTVNRLRPTYTGIELEQYMEDMMVANEDVFDDEGGYTDSFA